MNPPIDTETALVVPTSTAVDLDHLRPLVAGVAELAGEADASATLRAYAADWRGFQAWCVEKRLSSALPVDPKVVALYLRWLFDLPRKVKTIERALAGIVHQHRSVDADWVTPNLIRKEIRGIRKRRRRAGERVTKKDPLTKDKLALLLSVFGASLTDLRDRAMILLAWDTASRESEVLDLDMADVTFFPAGMVMDPRSTKTDQEGRESAKAVEFAVDPTMCPVRAVQAWLAAAKITGGALFRPVARGGIVRATRLTTRAFRLIIKKRALAAGLDPELFSGHSLRSGWITEAKRSGRDMTAIMSRSHHKSEAMVREYVHYEDLFKKNASKGLL